MPGSAGLPPREFALERFYARWEFEVPHDLSASDVEPMSLGALLDLADAESMELWTRLRLGYTESAGHPLLRQEIAGLYERAAPDDVLTFSGAEEGILLAIGALVGPGEHVVVVAPAYQSLYDVARARGAEVTLVWLDAQASWELDVERVVEALRPSTRLLVVNFPNNPTGGLPDAADFHRLAAACAERGIRFFSDEVYRGVELEPERRLPAAADLAEEHISLGVMSKAYGLAGLRIGWIVCRDASLIRRMAALRDYTTICSSAPSEILAIMALRAGGALLDRSRTIIRENLARWTELAASLGDRIAWIAPRGGTTAFPSLPGRGTDAFCERLAAEDGVLLLPGSMFDLPGEHFRVGLGRSGIETGLAILAERLGTAR